MPGGYPVPQTIIRERTSAATAVEAGRDGRIKVALITPGQGSSGYYSESVLEAAASEKVWPKGTLMFLDHATESDAFQRPERSVREVGAFLTEDATWDGTSLSAEARLVGPYADTIREMAEVIGVSISAAGDLKEGQITKLYPNTMNSVDFVTYPGRGGSFALLESRRPAAVIERAIAHGVTEATANDKRQALQSAIADRFGGEKIWTWIRDFDDDQVWFEVESPDEDTLYGLGYTITDDAVVTLADTDPVEVTVHTEYVPVSPAGGSTTITTESREDTMPQIEEARLRQLEEDAGRARTAEAAVQAAEARATAAESERNQLRAREGARPIAAEVLNASESLTATARPRVIEGLVAGVQLRADGTVDEAAFRTAAEAARTAAEVEHAEVLEAAGVGRVRNGGQPGDDAEVTHEQAEEARHAAFGRKVG
jgi:hypothetical protein